MKDLRVFPGLLILVSCLGHASGQSRRTCLSYEPTVVKLTGVVISRTFPGPPEYESIRKGDEPESYWLLALPRPVCVNQAADSAGYPFNLARKNIRWIQLVFNSEKGYDSIQEVYDAYRPLLGKRILATGTLYGRQTPQHKTRVLLWVHTLRELPKGPNVTPRH